MLFIIDRAGDTKVEDEKILDLYWQRSESAIKETAKKYESYCYTIAHNILQNKQDAEECLNDAFLKVWNAIPPGRPKFFRSFLGKVTRNLSLNKYKEKTVKKRGNGEADLIFSELEDCISTSNAVEREYEAGLVNQAINSFLQSIDKNNRIVFVRRYWYADSIHAIAERFTISESKVKSMLFRTRKLLKTYLENEGALL